MRVAFVTERFYQADRLFDRETRDDAFQLLPPRLEALGHEVHTADVFEARREIPDLLVYVDAHMLRRWRRPGRWRRLPRWLLLIEPEVTLPANGSARRAARFDRVFTWRRSRADGTRTFELRLPYRFEAATPRRAAASPDRFCTLIAANKRYRHRLALYPERRAAIRWFERNHPDEFDLYGHRWDLFVFPGPPVARALDLLVPERIRRLAAPSYPSYRGAIADKLEVLSHYRFSICFENARKLDGYLTEKLFDCFVAGSVPVYWGAPDIAELVPGGYVDFREFESYDALYEHLRSMSDEEWTALRDAGRAFVESERARRVFGFETWADTLVTHIDGQLRG